MLKEAMDQGRMRRADPQVAALQLRALLDAEVGEAGLLNARPEPSPAQIKAIVKRAIGVFIMVYGPNSPVSDQREAKRRMRRRVEALRFANATPRWTSEPK